MSELRARIDDALFHVRKALRVAEEECGHRHSNIRTYLVIADGELSGALEETDALDTERAIAEK